MQRILILGGGTGGTEYVLHHATCNTIVVR